MSYSHLVNLMDSVRDSMPDIVLLSNRDADVEGAKFADEARHD